MPDTEVAGNHDAALPEQACALVEPPPRHRRFVSFLCASVLITMWFQVGAVRARLCSIFMAHVRTRHRFGIHIRQSGPLVGPAAIAANRRACMCMHVNCKYTCNCKVSCAQVFHSDDQTEEVSLVAESDSGMPVVVDRTNPRPTSELSASQNATLITVDEPWFQVAQQVGLPLPRSDCSARPPRGSA